MPAVSVEELNEYLSSIEVDTDQGPALRLGKRSRRARLPVTDDEKAAPLHLPSRVGTIDVQAVVSWMKPAVKARFAQVWEGVNSGPPSPSPARISAIDPCDVDALHAIGVVRPSDLNIPTKSHCIAFTVVEERDGKLRRRFILYDPAANKWYANSVGTLISLPHVSAHAKDILSECATVRDIEGGFFQVPLEESACPAYRFIDRAGRTFEMCVAPIGMSGVPEICQTLTSTIAGHPDFAVPAEQLKIGSIKIHIDDVRVAHKHSETERVAAFFSERSARCGVHWKASGATGSVSYVFLGLVWDHIKKTIGLSPKTISKLQSSARKLCDKTLTYSELESLSGRLIYATGALGYCLAFRYLTMRDIRRVLRRAQGVHDVASINAWLSRKIQEWITVLVSGPAKYRAPSPGGRTAWLFTDASLRGYGAILVTDLGQIWVCGKSWSHPDHVSGDINWLESSAVSLAVRMFESTIREEGIKCLHLVVDNSSTQRAIERRCSRSVLVSAAIIPALKVFERLEVGITARHLCSGDNPADSISRGFEVDLPKLRVMVEKLSRKGGSEPDLVILTKKADAA